MAHKNRRGKGEGSIYRRGDGYWVGSCEAGWRWSEAKQKLVRRQARVVRKRRADVVAALDELRRQVGAGVVPDRTVTVERYMLWWLDTICAGNVAESTLEQYRTQATQWVIPYVGRYRLHRLRKAHVAQMMSALAAPREGLPNGYSASVRAQALKLLRQMLNFAVSDDVLLKNPADGVKGPNVEAKTDDTPSEDEARAILATVEGERLEAMAFLVLKYGMRQGELRMLRWSQVGDELTVVRSTTKTDASARTLPLTDEARAVLAEHRKRQAAERLAAVAWADDDLVFADEAGRMLSRHQALGWWHKLCARAGVRQCRMHAGRHAAATLLFEADVPIEVVSAILGHKDVATTRQVYLRIREDIKRRALREIA